MSTTNVLITGVNRGLGLAFAQTYLARSNHTVIGTVRDVAAARASGLLEDTPAAPGSKLILVKIEATSFADPAKAVEELAAQGITKLDIVIANAGIAEIDVVAAAAGDAQYFADTLAVNVAGPLALFAATHELLDRAESPKWVSISTVNASITTHGAVFEFMGRRPLGFGYGASKAALNHLSLSIHNENPKLTVLMVSPGLMATDMGIRAANTFGIGRPPNEPIGSAKAISEIVDVATRETHSGKFLEFDGKEIPW